MAISNSLLLALCFTVVLTSPATDAACVVNSSILSFPEDVPEGTVIMRISRAAGDEWAFREDGPPGYIGLHSDANDVIFTFLQTPDLEKINNGSSRAGLRQSLPFTLECTYEGWKHVFKQEIVLVDVNDHDPYFTKRGPFVTTVSEMAAVDTPVFDLRDLARDPDVTGRVTGYQIHSHSHKQVDGSAHFAISPSGNGILLKKAIDYDQIATQREPYYILNMSAIDDGYPDPRRAFTEVRVVVADADDQGPAFVYKDCPLVDGYCATPSYEAAMKVSYKGPLKIWPGPIYAEDRDSLNYSINYYIVKVKPPGYENHFSIDEETGEVTVRKPLLRANIDTVHINIKAEELSSIRRFVTTTLRIQILSNHGNYFGNMQEMFHDMPVNDLGSAPNVAPAPAASQLDASLRIPLSIFVATLGVFLLLMVVMLVIFVKVARTKPLGLSRDKLRYRKSQRRKASADSMGSTATFNSGETSACVVYSVQDASQGDNQSTDSQSSAPSSLDLNFDDAISFASPRSPDGHVTSVHIPAAHDHGHDSPPPPSRQNVSAMEKIRRKVGRMFSTNNGKKKNRVRFDIRNVSNY